MLHPTPPEGSYVDSNGKRWITLDIDIMVNHGERFFCTFRYTAPVTFDYEIGWLTCLTICKTHSISGTRRFNIETMCA